MIAVCPGSYDPVTFGHLDVIARAAALFGEVIVAVGRNTAKNPLFSFEERLELLRAACADIPGVRVAAMDGLLVDFCREHGAQVVVKGLRFASDFDYELQMAHINCEIGEIETVMLPASKLWGTLSSTMVREIAHFGGDISGFVPKLVVERAKAKKEHLDG
ncbi:MAG: pantetheine-phosphate adenylyltransferase [Propionibacteriaceae bacterium]|jgi:pantetheine-phosphate adenylyltransferase|nr:pantetheine-phosphate adenylyltransferase [Propionibacteriaceae bacterium]